MSGPVRPSALSARIVAVHEMLGSLGLAHQFGGAIALAWYRNPRATTDIDVNITLPPQDAGPVLGAIAHLGVTVGGEDRAAIAADGQARLLWEGSYLDVFFATLAIHEEMERWQRHVRFGALQIPILAPEHLIVCKAIFGRDKDWLDIEEMIAWGTAIDADLPMRWIAHLLGPESVEHRRLSSLLAEEG